MGLFYIALFLTLSTPMLITIAYTELSFSPKPITTTKYEENMGIWYKVYEFSPYAFVGSIATLVWIVFCFAFNPIAKYIFPQHAITSPPINIAKVCEGCCLSKKHNFGCFMSPKRCGKYTFKNGVWKEALL
jgi:hypothetical protein